ncbi:hypothetical protein TVAG_102790 [Trichomonas vaginalis G3]|uniref:DUF3447 domain-containing protein n=1 Tax=Trichomonas vaginalis (strain ATCC PRA-98 / G3) TaxID=412133 RepID=A2ECY4_TRIV3|nr:spectrin binding [Trichomonas vaginalis G3]EAY09529.1 hypothetical protein TVAG_102790 [Trichomonas vaginalis G3]KAI5512990.1 spectrin binding [Trichomonas vaginalis G3]|eukprot:XP_001321752.1 hypothetical protein [Trichomonas vaginalis G3]
MSESGYFDCYFYYKMFLYPKDTIMYHTVMDDLNSFQQEEVKHNGAPFSKYVEFAENEESLLDLAAKFGSVNIFKYLVMSHPEIPMSSQTFNSAVQGGNLEIIRYTMQYTKTSSVSLNKAVKFNNIELVDWMINEYQTLPSIYVTMINVTRFFFPLLDRMKYSPIREQQFAIEAALTNGHEELALYILKKFGNGKMDFKSIINLMIDRDYDEFIKFFLELPYITKKKDIRSIIDNFIIANHPISKEYLSYQIFKQNIDVLAKYSMKNLNVFKFLYDNGFDLENFYFEKYGNNFYDQFHINSQELRDARPELADAFKIVLEKCTDEAKILNQYLVKVLKSGNTYLLESLKNLKKFKKVLNDFDRDGFLLKFNSTLSTEFIGKMFEMMSGNHYDPHKSLIHMVCRRALRFDHIDTIYSFYSEKNCLDFRSNTPFYLLVSCRKYDLALQILEKYFAEIDLNVKNSKGMTPLLLAVINYRNGNRRLYDLIYLMVKYGAEPEIQSAHGVTAISVIKNTNRKSDLHKLFPGYFDN